MNGIIGLTGVTLETELSVGLTIFTERPCGDTDMTLTNLRRGLNVKT